MTKTYWGGDDMHLPLRKYGHSDWRKLPGCAPLLLPLVAIGHGSDELKTRDFASPRGGNHFRTTETGET